MDREIQRKRLIYRATHRGTKEADAIVGGFVTAKIQALTATELDDLEALLDCPDADLMDWLRGVSDAPVDAKSNLLNALIAYQKDMLTD